MIMDALKYITNLFHSMLLSLEQLIINLFYSLISELLSACISILNSFVDALEFLSFNEYFQYLPNEFMQAVGALGLNQAFAIMLSAHLIKIMLQLIPFVRLGAK